MFKGVTFSDFKCSGQGDLVTSHVISGYPGVEISCVSLYRATSGGLFSGGC